MREYRRAHSICAAEGARLKKQSDDLRRHVVAGSATQNLHRANGTSPDSLSDGSHGLLRHQ
jgi:hypothetical protein